MKNYLILLIIILSGCTMIKKVAKTDDNYIEQTIKDKKMEAKQAQIDYIKLQNKRKID